MAKESFYFGKFDLFQVGCWVNADYCEYHDGQGRVEIDNPQDAVAFEDILEQEGIEYNRSTPDPRGYL